MKTTETSKEWKKIRETTAMHCTFAEALKQVICNACRMV